jgi:carbamoyl-phosphate synthase large subunit
VKVANGSPVLLDRFLNDAIEVDVDALCDGKDVVIGGIMEHIEQAGVHSGDSACSLPPFSLSRELQDELRRQTVAMAQGLNVVGLMNVQFAIQFPEPDGRGVVYVLEVNPRASRTVPYVSKATGRPLAKIAARCMVGQSLRSQGISGVVPGLFGQGGCVSVHQVPRRRHYARAGNEIDRRGDGRGRVVRRGVPQVAACRGSEATEGRQRVRQRQGPG